VLQERQVSLVPWVRSDLLVPRGELACLDHLVHWGPSVLPGHWDLRDQQDRQDFRVPQDPADQMDHRALQVRLGHLERQVPLASREIMETSEWLVYPVHLVLQARQDQVVLTDLPVHLVLLALRVSAAVQEGLGSRVLRVHWVHQGRPAVPAPLDFRDRLDRSAHQDHWATPETLALPDRQDQSDLRVLPERLGQPDLLAQLVALVTQGR